jgi:hypothetical protein
MFSPVILKQRALNETQTGFLESFLFDNSTYGNMFAACFEPHLGIVFYQDSQIKFIVNICLDCNYLSSSTIIPATSHNLMKFETGTSLELMGFSELGREKIIDLGGQLNFRYNKSNTSTSFP